MPSIDFDAIINHRVDRNYVLNLFIHKQNYKPINPLRCALHNMSVKNIHELCNAAILRDRQSLLIDSYAKPYTRLSESPYVTYMPLTLEQILSKDEDELDEYIPAFLYDD